MKKLFPITDEFYIGYASSPPKATFAVIKKIVFWGLLLILIVASLLATNQRDFRTSEFEYGIVTSVSGELLKSPVPHIRISYGKDLQGQEIFQSVLLVGSGKSGFDQCFQNFRSGIRATVKGFLIYGDGKTLLQVNDTNDILLDKEIENKLPTPTTVPQKQVSIMGEIVDPKCYFGVMKPGEGKSHRSCAIRCMAGGIPAVLKTNSSDYFLLVNENMQSVNSEVLSIVGDQVSLTGEVVGMDDWKILKVDAKKISAIATSVRYRKMLLAIENEMSLCNH